MLSLLVTLLVVCLVGSIAYWAITLLPLPPPAKQIAIVIVVIIILIVALQSIGIGGGRPWIRGAW